MEEHPCFKVFTEIMYHNSRLSVLGKEAIQVLEVMEKEGMAKELLGPFVEVAMKAAGTELNVKEKEEPTMKRCKWWNRGYCREKGECRYSHPKDDCEDHLKGSCITKRCITLRHRKNVNTSIQREDVAEEKHVNIFMKKM